MSNTQHPEMNHWHTSEINFGSVEAARNCLAALEKQANQKIIVHGDSAQVLFEGYFDFCDFDDEFKNIITQHCQQPCKYAVKNIFNDSDGYFGGWTIVFNEKGDVLKETSLNDMFESEY